MISDLFQKKPISAHIPKCVIDSNTNNGFLHGYFVENLIKSIHGVYSVDICPLSGNAKIEVYSYALSDVKTKLLNLKDLLGNKVLIHLN